MGNDFKKDFMRGVNMTNDAIYKPLNTNMGTTMLIMSGNPMLGLLALDRKLGRMEEKIKKSKTPTNLKPTRTIKKKKKRAHVK